MATVTTSIIDKKNVSVDSLSLPLGIALASAPNLTPTLGKLAFNLTDNRVYAATGAVWQDIASLANLSMSTFGATPNAEGASIVTAAGAQTLTLQPASGTFPGGVSTTTQTFKGTKTFADGLSFDDAPTSAFVVSKLFNFMYQANFQGINIVNYTGCVTPGTKEIVATNLQSVASLAFGQFLPGAGVYAAGVINVNFPNSANPGFPGALPTEFVPNTNRTGIIPVVDNGVVKIGAFKVDSVGFVTVGTGLDNVGNLLNFTANGANGILDCVGTYF